MSEARPVPGERPHAARPRGRPRLLLVSPLPPPTGGIPTWTLAVLESPLAERFDIRVVDSSPSRKGEVAGASRFRLDRARDALSLLGRLAAALLRFRPQIVHVNTPYYWALLRDGLALWLAAATGARTVLHFRGGDFPEFAERLPRPGRALLGLTLRRADRLVALTGPTRRYLESVAPPERVRYLPNFVRSEELAPEAAAPADRPPEAPVRVLYVGWMLEAKGLRELVAAVRTIPELHLTLVGPREPAFLDSIRAELEALGGRVRLLPEQPRESIRALYREAELFVLPTHREGFPNVLLEAMAAGLPVVATPVGAIPDVLRDGREGLLVPPRDTEALADALRRLAGDAGLRARMGARARERAEAAFSRPAVLAELEALYAELLRKPAPAARLRRARPPRGAPRPSSRRAPGPPDR